jgi:hypothetical protein
VLCDDGRYSTASHVVEPPLSPLAASLCPIRLDRLDAQTSNGLQPSLLAFVVDPHCLCCISCYLGAPLCRIRLLWQKHRRSPAGSILPAWRALESDRLRCRWGPTRLRCTTGHLPGCYTDDIVYWFANLRLQDSVQHRVSGTVSWCFPAAGVASQLAPRLFRTLGGK